MHVFFRFFFGIWVQVKEYYLNLSDPKAVKQINMNIKMTLTLTENIALLAIKP